MKACDIVISASAPIDLNGVLYEGFLAQCDNVFREAIQQTYTNYVIIGSPVITQIAVNNMVESYITSMQSHFNAFNDLLGFKQKSVMKKNEHLTQSGYYKRQVFYNMLAMSRQKNKNKMKHWAMISAGANYGRGIGEIVNRRATYLGASTTTQTFLRTVRPFGNAMIENITATLSHVNKTVWMLDNNQRGHPLKFQRFGSSNNFVKVTGRTSKQCNLSSTDLGEEDTKHCVLTYVDQDIANPVNFPVFELEVTDINNLGHIHSALTRQNALCESPIKMDITGNKV